MSKINFNDHLDDMMDRLMNEDITTNDLEKEVKRSKALCQVADRKIAHNKTVIIALKMVSAGDIKSELLNEDLIPKQQLLKPQQNQ